MNKRLTNKEGEVRELTRDDLARMRPASEVCPDVVVAHRRGRGPQKQPTKQLVSIRLSREVIEYFKSLGRGWQTLINRELLRVARRHSS